MAVLHFKTKGGFIAFIAILIIVLSIPLAQYMGTGGFIALMLLDIVVILFIALMTRNRGHLTAQGRNNAAIKNSSGIEKLRLKIRLKATALGQKLINDTSMFGVELMVMEAYIHLADAFYGFTKEQFKETDRSKLLDEMSEAIVSDESKESTVSVRLFGIAFGIVMEKVADSTNLKVKKTAIKNLVDSCTFDEADKKEFLKMSTAYLNLQKSDTKKTWNTLEEMTYALFDATIKRSKGDVGDPIVIMPLKTAIAYVQNGTQANDSCIKAFKEAGLIG